MKNGIDKIVSQLVKFVREQRKTNTGIMHLILNQERRMREHERWMRSHEVRLTSHWKEISKLKWKS